VAGSGRLWEGWGEEGTWFVERRWERARLRVVIWEGRVERRVVWRVMVS